MNSEKYLPIGSVLKLKKGTKEVMIIGYLCTTTDDKEKVYDYCGCLYPEGYLGSDKTLFFNHDDIDIIYSLGYINQNSKDFIEKLKTIKVNNN